MDSRSAATIQQELANAALSCVALGRARRLAEWVGEGKGLTTRGVIRPVDAVQACQLLGIELQGPRLRSALDVDELMRDRLAAEAAGFIEIYGRRAWASPTLPQPAPSRYSDPEAILASWVFAAIAVLDLGDEPCAACVTVINRLYTASGSLTTAELEDAVLDAEELGRPEWSEDARCPNCGEIHSADDGFGLASFLQAEAEHDAARHVERTVSGLVAFGAVDTSDGAVRLTTLGGGLAAGVIEGRAPAPDADVAAVAMAISDLPRPVARTVAGPWLETRSPAGAAEELLAFAESATGSERAAAVVLARELGPDSAPAWRDWAKRPGIGAYAREWLRTQDENLTEDRTDEAWLAVDALTIMLDRLIDTVPPLVLQALLIEEVGGDIAEAAEMILRSGHSRATEVVASLTGRPAAEGPSRLDPGTVIYQLKITLCEVSDPPVWRRVLVPAGMTLRGLHGVVQRAMGWEDYHLYVFSKGQQKYGTADPELEYASDQQVHVSEVLPRRGSKLGYTYDFGDYWEHEIVVEEKRPMADGETYPSCVEGRGACPQEDCGGPWGYASLKEVVASPSHEDHLERLDWLGLDTADEFNPDVFSADEANARLAPLVWAP
jgi:Plasmid pRiA4b ORF-3-like protein